MSFAPPKPPPSPPAVRVSLTPPQHRYLTSPAKFRAFVGGRGAGKSFVGAYDLFRRARAGRLYLVTAPTYPMLRDATLRSVQAVAELLGRPVRLRKGDMAATLACGAEVLFRSTDNPDRLRGPNYAGAWMDEASLSRDDALDVVVASLRQHGEMGWLGATFTPKGLAHWTYQRFGGDPRPDTELVRSRTDENPFLPPDFAATIAAQYDDLFAAQELGGEFVDIEGAEWPASYFRPGVWFEDWPKAEDTALTVIAFDPHSGTPGSKDFAAYTVVKADHRATFWVDAVMIKGGSVGECVGRGVQLIEQHRPNHVAVEVNIGQALLKDEFDRQCRAAKVVAAVDGVMNTQKKHIRVRATLGKYLKDGRLRFRRTAGGKLLVGQMQVFPNGDFDDGPDSLEMAMRAMETLYGAR